MDTLKSYQIFIPGFTKAYGFSAEITFGFKSVYHGSKHQRVIPFHTKCHLALYKLQSISGI